MSQSGLTDDDKRRIREYANKYFFDRKPDDLLPDDEE